MSSSKKQDSGTSGSSLQTHSHQTPSSVVAPKETPHQENPTEQTPDHKNPTEETPNQETETPEKEQEESSDDDSDEEESSEEEYVPNEEVILFPDTSNDEEYDDITFFKYIQLYEKKDDSWPLPISINDSEPTREDMTELHLYIERYFKARYADFSRCRLRNKIIRMQNKYRNILQEKGENPTVQDFNTPLGKLQFELMKMYFTR